MTKLNVESSFSSKFKHIFGDFQFVINTAIDDEDVKEFIIYGFKRILKKEKKFIALMLLGLILLISGFFSFLGLCMFLVGLVYIGVQLVKFVSGVDEETFEEIKIELEQEEITQTTLKEYVNAQINKKKVIRRKRS